MKNMEHVNHYSIKSQGVEVDTLSVIHLRTQSEKSKMVSLLRKFTKRGKWKVISSKYEFRDSLSMSIIKD